MGGEGAKARKRVPSMKVYQTDIKMLTDRDDSGKPVERELGQERSQKHRHETQALRGEGTKKF